MACLSSIKKTRRGCAAWETSTIEEPKRRGPLWKWRALLKDWMPSREPDQTKIGNQQLATRNSRLENRLNARPGWASNPARATLVKCFTNRLRAIVTDDSFAKI